MHALRGRWENVSSELGHLHASKAAALPLLQEHTNPYDEGEGGESADDDAYERSKWTNEVELPWRQPSADAVVADVEESKGE